MLREKFEQWYRDEMDNCPNFDLWYDTEYYADSDVQRTWRGYQAGAQQAILSAPNV